VEHMHDGRVHDGRVYSGSVEYTRRSCPYYAVCRHDGRVRNIHHLIKFKSKVKCHTGCSSQLVQLGRMAGVVLWSPHTGRCGRCGQCGVSTDAITTDDVVSYWPLVDGVLAHAVQMCYPLMHAPITLHVICTYVSANISLLKILLDISFSVQRTPAV